MCPLLIAVSSFNEARRRWSRLHAVRLFVIMQSPEPDRPPDYEKWIKFVNRINELSAGADRKLGLRSVSPANPLRLWTPSEAGQHVAHMTDDRCFSDFQMLADLLESLGVESVFIVADQGAFQHSGAKEKLLPQLKSFQVTLFSDFVPNPRLSDVLSGLKRFRESGATAVIAVGGGTAIDIAKLIAGFSNEESSPISLIRKQSSFQSPSLPLIAIPTTAGTGSEATQFAVVYVEGVKYSVDHPKLMPGFCVLDPELTQNLPPRVTAQTGLDAFCQGVESIWSVHATDASIADAAEAVQLAYRHLSAAVHTPDQASRAGMLRASHLAGRAINRTRTTAPHAISYAFTSDFGIPHGHAVALTLGPLLVHNAEVTEQDANDPRGAQHIRGRIQQILKFLNCESPRQGLAAVQQFVESVGCETSLRELQIEGETALRGIAAKVNVERLNNNPRRLSTEQIFQILQSIEQKAAS